ncbi:MAG TPA: bifunctional nuclease family protein [Acidimicrobiales bacterium]
MVEVALRAVRVDLQSRTPVLVLQETGELRRSIPIFIGEPEAVAIECAVRGIPTPRPLTHDLLRDVITELGATVSRVVITELRDATYFAEIHLNAAGATSVVSARPSDAVALALRTESPLFVDDELMDEEGRLIELADEEDEDEEAEGDVDEIAEQFRDFLDTVHPEDFQQ